MQLVSCSPLCFMLIIVIWCYCVAGKHDAWKETEFKGGACACRLWARRSFK